MKRSVIFLLSEFPPLLFLRFLIDRDTPDATNTFLCYLRHIEHGTSAIYSLGQQDECVF